MRVLLGLILIILLSPIFANSKTLTKILIIGDSITEGHGVDLKNAYPYLLEQKINKKEKRVTVVNAGIGGSTSASAYGRLKWQLKSKPDILLLALGGNDGLRGSDISSMSNNLAKTISLAQSNGIKVILAGMKIPMNYGESYRAKFEKVFPDLAKKHKITFIPFLLEGVGGVAKYNLSDGIHPNEAGQKKIAETVYKYIVGAL